MIFIPPQNKETDSCSVILTQRSQEVATHKGQVSFPGGKAEPSEKTPQDTALREIEEEIHLPSHHLKVHGVLKPLPSLWGLTVWPVVMTAFFPAHKLKVSREVNRVLCPSWHHFEESKTQNFRFKVFIWL